MFNLFSNLRCTKPWKICQKWPRNWVRYCPHHIPSFLQSKSCWNPGEWHTHSPSASTSPKPAKPESSQPARNPPALTLHSSPSLEMILERRLLRIYVPQNARDATHTLIQTLMNYPYPLVPSPFKWIQLHLETISPSSFSPSTVCSIGLARACIHLAPSLVSLMSKQLPSK